MKRIYRRPPNTSNGSSEKPGGGTLADRRPAAVLRPDALRRAARIEVARSTSVDGPRRWRRRAVLRGVALSLELCCWFPLGCREGWSPPIVRGVPAQRALACARSLVLRRVVPRRRRCTPERIAKKHAATLQRAYMNHHVDHDRLYSLNTDAESPTPRAIPSPTLKLVTSRQNSRSSSTALTSIHQSTSSRAKDDGDGGHLRQHGLKAAL